MQAKKLEVDGLLVGLSEWLDYESKEPLGEKLQVGRANEAGRFEITTIKVAKTDVQVKAELNNQVTLILTDVAMSAFLNNNRAELSIKCDSAIIAPKGGKG